MKKNDNLVFGIRPVIEAIKNGKSIDKIFIKKGLSGELFRELNALLNQFNIQPSFVPQEKLNKITFKNHQGVCAYLSPVEFTDLENLIPIIYEQGKTPLFLILDGVTDTRNFGAIIRTAECTGVNAIIIGTKNSAPINADTVKTSTGAIFNIPICKEPNLNKTVDMLQQNGIEIFAATEKGNQDYFELKYENPLAIIMGSEESGVSDTLIRKTDHLAKIPIVGMTESLNVSVAAGVFLYECLRQRLAK